MLTLVLVIGLVLVVVAVAYVLGRSLRRRSESTPVAASLARLAPPQPRLESVADPETRAVVGWLLSQAFEQTGLHVADDPLAHGRIVNAAQKAIEELKTQDATTIALPFLTADTHGPKHLECRLTREVIQELIRS